MELKYKRKIKMPLYNLPGFMTGFDPQSLAVNRNNPLGLQDFKDFQPQLPTTQQLQSMKLPQSNYKSGGGKIDVGKGGSIVSDAIAFIGSGISAFGPVKNENELISDSGKMQSYGAGFNYTSQNNIDRQAQLSELSKENTGTTLKTTAAGAALGASVGSIFPGAGTLIGGAVGGVAGALTGIFGGASRKRKLKRKMFNAQQEVNRYNNFAQSSAQSDYLDQTYDANHENTQDDVLYANKGKDQNMILPGFKSGKSSYTSLGKQNIQPNARVAAAESIIDNIDDINNTTGHVVKDGKLNQDTNYANVNDGTVILGNDVDWRTGVNFRDQALPYTVALEKINQKYEARTNSKLNKLRGKIGLESDNVQQMEVNKLKQPIVQKLKDLSEQQKYQHQITNNMQYGQYKNGKDYSSSYEYGSVPEMDWASNAIPMGIGALTSLGQYFQAKNQDIKTPDIYAANPYENTALSQLARLRSNPYPILRQIQDSDSRNRYAINRAGGLSGAQKYIANVASGLATNSQLADALFKSQIQDNEYRGQYANALLNTGNSNAQRRQQANQYNTEYAASAHAAKQQGMQMGIRNFMDYLQQYSANEYKRRTGNGMLSLYQQKVDLDREALENQFPNNVQQPVQSNKKNNVTVKDVRISYPFSPYDFNHFGQSWKNIYGLKYTIPQFKLN